MQEVSREWRVVKARDNEYSCGVCYSTLKIAFVNFFKRGSPFRHVQDECFVSWRVHDHWKDSCMDRALEKLFNTVRHWLHWTYWIHKFFSWFISKLFPKLKFFENCKRIEFLWGDQFLYDGFPLSMIKKNKIHPERKN